MILQMKGSWSANLTSRAHNSAKLNKITLKYRDLIQSDRSTVNVRSFRNEARRTPLVIDRFEGCLTDGTTVD